MSKELEALEDIKDVLSCEGAYDSACEERCSTIEKSLKALEILKNRIDWKTYLMLSRNTFLEEEYNFLKEALL